eukprot:gene22662-30942_t
MRLSKHKLPKGVNKQERTVKHKDSEKKRLRKEAKAAKLNEMQVELNVIPPAPEAPISEEERQRIKAEVKLERKRENAPKVAYKKRILHMSGRNGPRAVNGGGF